MGDTEERLGEIRKNNFGTEMKIVEYKDWNNVIVEFQDDYKYRKRTNYSNFKMGTVKNPYDNTLFGVACLGEGKFKAYHKRESDGKVRPTQVYDVWIDMLKRCYYGKGRHKQPTYYGICVVCKEWLNFQVFAQWYEDNKYEVEGRLHIDKDILCPNCMIYSPETCILIPQRINMLFMNKPNGRGLPNGIKRQGKGYLAKYNGEELGIYKTLEKAYKIYSEKKEKTIKRVADEYRDIIPVHVYEALYAYKVDINNDKNYVA